MSKGPASQDLSHDPILAKKYHHLKITSRVKFEEIQEFALAILKDRELAQYVRRITLNYTSWKPFPAKCLPYEATTTEGELEKETTFKAAIAEQLWDEEEAGELLKRLMTTSPPGGPGFNKPSPQDLHPDAVVALLLPILPNLEQWTVGDISRPEYVGKAIQRAKDEIFGSISITHVKILADNKFSDAAWADYNFSCFDIFAKLPNLNCISGKAIGGVGIEDAGIYDEIPERASDVKKIFLRQCELSGGCLSKIIGFSTGLEDFTYRFGGRGGDGTGVVYSPQLALVLTPHRLALRSLDMDVDSLIYQGLGDEIQNWEEQVREELEEEEESATEDGDEDEKDLEDEDSKASNAALDSTQAKDISSKEKAAAERNPIFPHLKRLRIGIKLATRFAELAGKKSLVEWLPASLEEFEILGYKAAADSAIEKQVMELAERREELLPNLTVLKGIDEYIENGTQLENEDGYVASEESD